MSAEADILKSCKVVAVVGLSSDPERPSYRVASFLKENGYRIIPVNPNEEKIIGAICYPDLMAIPEKVDVVDIFRRSEDIMPVVEKAIKIGAKAVWMQEGIVNQPAADKALKAGLRVVMDKCMLKELIKIQESKK
ncbi:MAG: CoA-binding protein [Dehalococcoidales bacterium]|nr:CoA-binding protein [Dehalococcoidales bacterium]